MTDQSGAVLPGVTVTATSPALQVPQVVEVTNEQGEYRLAPLPIGVYQVSYELAGFRPVQRQDVRLTVGFIARIDVPMGLATVAETINVSGAAPVVDVTSTTNQTLLTREQLELTPTSRNSLMSILALAPGVRTRIDVGGDQALEDPDARVFGQAGEMWTTLEGIGITSQDTESGSGRLLRLQHRRRIAHRGHGRHGGGPDARHSEPHHREVGRQRLPRRRVLGPDRPEAAGRRTSMTS